MPSSRDPPFGGPEPGHRASHHPDPSSQNALLRRRCQARPSVPSWRAQDRCDSFKIWAWKDPITCFYHQVRKKICQAHFLAALDLVRDSCSCWMLWGFLATATRDSSFLTQAHSPSIFTSPAPSRRRWFLLHRTIRRINRPPNPICSSLTSMAPCSANCSAWRGPATCKRRPSHPAVARTVFVGTCVDRCWEVVGRSGWVLVGGEVEVVLSPA